MLDSLDLFGPDIHPNLFNYLPNRTFDVGGAVRGEAHELGGAVGTFYEARAAERK